MIRWTPAGAVTSPRTVQVRAQQRYPGRVRAGAPLPSRDLSAPELWDNLRYFTVEMRTPRTVPCTALVLSGAGVLHRPDLADAIARVRAEGVQQVTLHADDGDASPAATAAIRVLVGQVDRLTVPIRAETLAAGVEILALAQAVGMQTTASVPLDQAAVADLGLLAAALGAIRPGRVVWTYPFPAAGEEAQQAPLPSVAVEALRAALPYLDGAGVPTHIKGLPACYLGELGPRLGRTANRWYVDADHQKSAALLFFPEVVAFFKAEACRFCVADGRCDGFFAAHLGRPGVKPLRPLGGVSGG